MEGTCLIQGVIENLDDFNTCDNDDCDFCSEIDSIMSDMLFEEKYNPKDKRDSFVYLMYDKSYYKIGKSVDPVKRCLNLRIANLNIKLLAYGNGTTEKELHKEYKAFRVGGEWFKLNEKQVQDIIQEMK